jgi:hypothetical protein
MQIGKEEQEHPIKEEKKVEDEEEESSAYSLFVYGIRSQITRDYYLRRLRIFFNHIGLFSEGIIEERCS